MQPTHFTTLYQTYPTEKLVEVVLCPGDYQPEAIAAAQAELDKRNIPAEELERLKIQVANTKPEPNLVAELATDAASYTGKKIHEYIFPKGPSTAESLLNRFSVLLFILALLKIYTGWDLMYFILFNDEARFGPDVLVYFSEYLGLAVIFFLIWRRKRSGWFLLSFYTVYALIMTAVLIEMVLTWKPSPYAILRFPQPSLAPHLVWGAFWAGVVYLICRKDVREIFNIKTKTMLYSIIIPALIILFFMWVEL